VGGCPRARLILAEKNGDSRLESVATFVTFGKAFRTGRTSIMPEIAMFNIFSANEITGSTSPAERTSAGHQLHRAGSSASECASTLTGLVAEELDGRDLPWATSVELPSQRQTRRSLQRSRRLSPHVPAPGFFVLQHHDIPESSRILEASHHRLQSRRRVFDAREIVTRPSGASRRVRVRGKWRCRNAGSRGSAE
jgi:hypothetical protein